MINKRLVARIWLGLLIAVLLCAGLGLLEVMVYQALGWKGLFGILVMVVMTMWASDHADC